MRKYLNNKDLSLTLDRLVHSDPVLIKIYAQVYCYKENPEDQKLKPVGQLLSSPRKLLLSVINLALMCVVLVLLPGFVPLLSRIGWVSVLVYGLAIFALWLFAYHAYTNYALMKAASDYLLVDELMERGIVKLKKN